MGQAHINSYYAATRNDKTTFAALAGAVQADVCVVGGGFSGVATALTMAERGYSVVLLEANKIGWGASGRNGGQVIAGLSGEAAIKRQLGAAGRQLLKDIRYRGNDIIKERIAKYAIDCDYKSGWMEAAARQKHMVDLRDYHAERLADGDGEHLELVEPEDMPALLGTNLYFGGLVDRRSGHLHPLNLLMGEARAAASLGVRLFEDTSAIEIQGGQKPFARTANGRVDAKFIVLAGDTDHKFNRGRLRGMLFPTGSYIITTEPLGAATAAAINPQDLAVADSNIVLDYFRLTGDKRMLFGGRCNYSNRDPGDLTQALRPRMAEIYPQLAKTKIEFSWGGRIGIVLNRVPAIGRLEPNLYYMQGYCGHGVNATHIAADIVSDAICGTTEKFELFDSIKHWQLPVGRWAGNQMLALGMLYFRLKDRL
ncbi:MAG: FAD-binding oxidoreductase [Hyphomicrobium sp.]